MSELMENKEAEIMEQDNNLTQCMCRFCGQVLEADEKVMADAGQDIKVAASLIVRNQAVGITLNVSPKEKVELKLGSKGIKCSRTVKETRVDECRT